MFNKRSGNHFGSILRIMRLYAVGGDGIMQKKLEKERIEMHVQSARAREKTVRILCFPVSVKTLYKPSLALTNESKLFWHPFAYSHFPPLSLPTPNRSQNIPSFLYFFMWVHVHGYLSPLLTAPACDYVESEETSITVVPEQDALAFRHITRCTESRRLIN